MIRKREGFTLVELLVVVAIIIILAAILFPIFSKAREKAQQTRCINNLKQIGSAIEMYEDDYQGGILPVTIGADAVGAADKGSSWGTYWQDLVDPYLKQLKKGSSGGSTKGQGEVYTCPSAPTDSATGGSSWQMGKTYGYNPYLNKNISNVMVKFPAVTLRITEVGDYTLPNIHDPNIGNQDPGYKGGSWYAPIPNRSKPFAYNLQLQAPGWHNGYNDTLWFDGHVSSVPWERIMYTDNGNGQTTDINSWCRLEPKEGFTPE